MKRLPGGLASFFALVAMAASAQAPRSQPSDEEILIHEGPIRPIVAGVMLELRASDFLVAQEVNDGIDLQHRIVINLSDLQRRTGDIIGATPLPTNNCDHERIDNLEIHIEDRQLTVDADRATIRIGGTALAWSCLNTPLGRIVTHTPPGQQRFAALIPFHLQVPDSRTISVELDPPSFSLEGVFGRIVEGVLRLGGVDLSSRLRDAILDAVDPKLLMTSIPRELEALQPRIVGATFFPEGGRLWAEIRLSTLIGPSTLDLLLEEIEATR